MELTQPGILQPPVALFSPDPCSTSSEPTRTLRNLLMRSNYRKFQVFNQLQMHSWRVQLNPPEKMYIKQDFRWTAHLIFLLLPHIQPSPHFQSSIASPPLLPSFPLCPHLPSPRFHKELWTSAAPFEKKLQDTQSSANWSTRLVSAQALPSPNLWLSPRCAGKTFPGCFHPRWLLANNLCFLFEDIFEGRLEAWKNTWNNSLNRFSKHWWKETSEVRGSIQPWITFYFSSCVAWGPAQLGFSLPCGNFANFQGLVAAEAATHPGRAGPSTSCCGNGTSGIPAATSSPGKSLGSTLCGFT